MKKAICIILCIALTVAATAGIVIVIKCAGKKHGKLQSYTIGDGVSLKVGVFSDSQLPKDGKESKWTKNLETTLTVLKEQDIDVLIMAGDFTDLGTANAWQSFSDAFDKVFGDDKPIVSFVMGNHDYWIANFFDDGDIPIPAIMQNRFIKYTGEYPYSHKVVNGYHFIAWSSSDGSYDKSYNDTEWIKEQLDIAVADDPTKPIFVTTHLAPADAVYGGDEWGNSDIYDVLKDYPQVVSFSGHSHYSLLDERSITQTKFTAINTQTIDYVELETGKFNGTVPKDAYGNDISKRTPMSLVMDVTQNEVSIQRLYALTGVKAKQAWVLKAPFNNIGEYSIESRTQNDAAPEFADNVNITVENKVENNGNPIKVLSFDSAADDDFVHSYRVVFGDENGNPVTFERTKYDGEIYKDKNGNTENISQLLYFSDFVGGLELMSSRTELRLPMNMPETVKTLTVYAVDSFGKESSPITVKVK